MKKYWALLRVKQWIKNIFVIVPAFFAGELGTASLPEIGLAFISFCLLASGIYIINDSRDVNEDRRHPLKRYRPIAAGTVRLSTALILALLLIATAFSLGFIFLSPGFLWVISIYFLLNLLYSLGLKQLSIIDLIIVSSGFVLRIIGGSEVVSVEISFWLLLMTFLFSMFIIIGKRRDDFDKGAEDAAKLRKTNVKYNLYFLNNGLILFSALMMVCYIMYTYSSPYFQGHNYLALISSVLVVVGLLRYLQAIFVENQGGSPTEFALKDRFIQIVLLLWTGIFCYLIYFS